METKSHSLLSTMKIKKNQCYMIESYSKIWRQRNLWCDSKCEAKVWGAKGSIGKFLSEKTGEPEARVHGEEDKSPRSRKKFTLLLSFCSISLPVHQITLIPIQVKIHLSIQLTQSNVNLFQKHPHKPRHNVLPASWSIS